MNGDAKLDWNDIRVFLAAVEAGSLSGAARALGLSQATAVRRLKRLEAVLGGRLFDRLPNALALSRTGAEFLADAQTMAEAATALLGRADAPSRLPASVRVSATTSVSLFLVQYIGVLTAAANGKDASVTLLASRTQAEPTAGEVEIALRMRRIPAEGALVSRRLGQVAFAPYASRAYWAARDPRAPWKGACMIGLPETRRAPSQSYWFDELAKARQATVPIRLGEVHMRQRAAQDGLGITLLPCFLGDSDPLLVRLMDPPVELIEDVFLLVAEDTRSVSSVRAVIGAIAKVFRDAALELTGGRASPARETPQVISQRLNGERNRIRRADALSALTNACNGSEIR